MSKKIIKLCVPHIVYKIIFSPHRRCLIALKNYLTEYNGQLVTNLYYSFLFWQTLKCLASMRKNLTLDWVYKINIFLLSPTKKAKKIKKIKSDMIEENWMAIWNKTICEINFKQS